MDENILARVPVQPLAELGNKNGEQCSLLGATPGWMVNNVLSWVPPLAEVGNKNGEESSLLGTTHD